MLITRKVEFDSGHRIPNHESKCWNVHGHRYVLEVTVTGPVISEKGSSGEGMVIDFASLKSIMLRYVAEPWDHAFLCHVEDPLLPALYQYLGNRHKTVVLPCVPTVENLAQQAFIMLKRPLHDVGLTLIQVRLYETPNCWADFRAEGK